MDAVVSKFGETHIPVIFDFAWVDVSAAFQQAPEKTQGGECEGRQAGTQALLGYCNSNDINWAYFSYYSLGTNTQTPVSHAEILAVLQSAL